MKKIYQERILKDGDKVPFIWKTPKLGRAEFQFDLVFLRGKLQKVLIFPLQQENVEECFVIPQYNNITFSCNSWTHEGLDNPCIWRHFWCKEHKAAAFNLYVPSFSTHFQVLGNDIYFSKKDLT